MEAAGTFETLVNFYQTTRHYNPEDGHLCLCYSYAVFLDLRKHYLFIYLCFNNKFRSKSLPHCLQGRKLRKKERNKQKENERRKRDVSAVDQ
jgi:hypothetical protein